MSGFQNVEPFVPDEQCATQDRIPRTTLEEFVPDDPCGCIGSTPTITSLVPSSVEAGSGAFTLTVNGTNFRPDSVVEWNGSPRVTTFINSTQLTAEILASDVLTSGTIQVRVFNPLPGCGLSSPATFTITSACVGIAPVILSLTPTSVVAGSGDFTLTVGGTGFVSGAIVQWNGVNLTTTFISEIQLTAAVPGADIALSGTANITVQNPI